jgi:hypothetical protein
MNPQERIEQFVATFLATMGSTTAPDVPDDMLASGLGISGWASWRPIKSPITETEISLVENHIGYKLPTLFKIYLSFKCLLMTDFGTVSLPEIRSDLPWQDFENYLGLFQHTQCLRENGYFPFGTDSRNGHSICFDLPSLNTDGDCPILEVDLERTMQLGYTPRIRNPSFSALLDEIEASLLSFK